MTAAQWITVASLAAVVVSALAIVAGLRSVRDQLRVTIFLEYTKRYSEIMQHMPFEAREPGGLYRLASQSKEERHRVLSVFREYLNMCSEEKWLHDHRRIDHATWRIWERGMQDTARFVTIQPELPMAEPVVDAGLSAGVVASGWRGQWGLVTGARRLAGARVRW